MTEADKSQCFLQIKLEENNETFTILLKEHLLEGDFYSLEEGFVN